MCGVGNPVAGKKIRCEILPQARNKFASLRVCRIGATENKKTN
jgi:hypothetical protein